MNKGPKKKQNKKSTIVREHKRKVPKSKKNPKGFTIVDRHTRRLPGTYLDANQIKKIFKNYDKKKIPYPTKNKLKKYKNADKYDDLIAVWTDFFNKKFEAKPLLEPDVVKALIASESGFREYPAENRKIALGITQITKPTIKILQDPKGEARKFTFKGIRQKDLKYPYIAIPMGIRWLFRKRATAKSKLKRTPTHVELILEYKGLLRSKTEWKKKALINYKRNYEKLKKK
ncbi:MAG: transglycosylase SLT domain-containing protein [Bacteriovoracaceae bacterium]